MRIYRDKRKIRRIFGGCALFLGLCFWGFLGELKKGTMGDAQVVLIWLTFGLIAASLPIGAWLLLDWRAALDIRDDGLIAIEISPDVIAWRHITAMTAITVAKQSMIELQIAPQALKTIRPSKPRVYIQRPNKMAGFKHFYISTAALEYNTEYILKALQARIDAAPHAETAQV